MVDIKTSGFAAGANISTVGGAIGALSDGVDATSFRVPSRTTGLPFITGNQVAGSTWSLDTTGLSNITAYNWRIVGGATLGTSATQSTMGQMNQWIECVVTADGTDYTTPAKRVYMMHSDAGHVADDQAALDLVPHEAATHIVISDGGNWSATGTWLGGRIPGENARVLIPHGFEVVYNVVRDKVRLHSVRVDGTFTTDTSVNTKILVNHFVITAGATMTDGIASSQRPSSTSSEWIISSKDTQLDTFTRGPLNLAGDDPKIMGRGIISMGSRIMWGATKTAWLRTADDSAPMATDTSLTLASTPTGWAIGDTIVIPGTHPDPARRESEERVITAISGATISWADPLLYDHDHHNSSVTRTDLQPGIANLSRNIVIRSEDPDAEYHQRGHTMDMHMACFQDLWFVEHRDLGRSFKEPEQLLGREGGAQDGSNFKYIETHNADGDGTSYEDLTAAMAATSNVKGRYAIHNHFCGFGKANTDTVNGCVVRGNIGWGMTHHGCQANYNNNVVYGFAGAGIAAETGDEIGQWNSNWVASSYLKSDEAPKVADQNYGKEGNAGRGGYAMHMTGRALVVVANFVADCTVGYNFYHRQRTDSWITQIRFYQQDLLDLKDLRGPVRSGGIPPKDYPILHFVDNEAVGCGYAGFAVTKNVAPQRHGWNVKLERFKCWGIGGNGAHIEYVVQYLLKDFDLVGVSPAAGANRGIALSNNTFGLAVLEATIEGCSVGVQISDTDANYPNQYFDDTDDPKFMIAGVTYINVGTEVQDLNEINAGEFVTRVWATTPTLIEPSHNLPFKLADWSGGATGGAGSLSNIQTGILTDSVSAAGPLPKVGNNSPGVAADDLGMPTSGASDYPTLLQSYLNDNGYYTYNSENVVVFPLYFADRLSGVPFKTWHCVAFTGSTSGATNNGAFTLSANAPAVSAAALSVASGGSGTIDVLALASDSDAGTTLAISNSFKQPNYGVIGIDGGDVTYTNSAFGNPSADEAILFVEDGQGNSTRVDLALTIT